MKQPVTVVQQEKEYIHEPSLATGKKYTTSFDLPWLSTFASEDFFEMRPLWISDIFI